MTYPAPDVLPYDAWFDPEYKYNPLDSMPIATDNPRPEEEIADDITMHERMYRLAVEKHSPWPGGSEEWQDSKPG